jgi:hypothetical protein
MVSTAIRFSPVLSVSVLLSYNSEMHVVLICTKRTMWHTLVRTSLDVLLFYGKLHFWCGKMLCNTMITVLR